MTTDFSVLRRSFANTEFWYRGDLSHLLRKDAQARAYRAIYDWKVQHPDEFGPFVLNCHRGMGKSFLLILLAIERALRDPNSLVRIGAPDREQCRSYARPILRQILEACPQEIYPTKVEDTWYFKNPRWGNPEAVSELWLISLKDDAEGQRGPRSDLIVIDEARNVENLGYVVEDILGWHFVGRNRPLMVLCSTPPESGAHPFSKVYVPEAQSDKRYIEIPVTENEDFRPQDKRALLKFCRGANSIAFKREGLCKLVSDPDRLIVSEFPEAQGEIVVSSWKRPEFFFPYLFMDTGWVDFTALIWAYPEWPSQHLIVEKTILVRKKNTGFIARLIKETEEELYGATGPYHQVQRVGDLTPQQLDDLEVDQGVTVLPAVDRHDPDATIAHLRTRIYERRIRIVEPTNRGLIYQLENGVRDPKTLKIPRTPELGHCDALMALAYGNRNVDYLANPFPRTRHFSTEKHYSQPLQEEDGPIRITRNPLWIHRRD